jgi:uncharacterized caspase-like protein
MRTIRMAFAAILLTAAGVIASSVLANAAASRVALVIGNSAYRNVSVLVNPVNDAKLMADTLQSLGFTLVGGGAQLDLDKAAFDTVVQTFGRQLQGAEVGLFYYAGHGVQVRGGNYLVPVNANPQREVDVDFQMFDTNLVLRQMEGSGTKLNLVILDACRNNPFGGRGLRSVTTGLAQMQAPEGTLISFATQPGNVAVDGTDGHSPYTKALAATMRTPGRGLFEVFNDVGLSVKHDTAGSQQPWLSSSPIAGNFYFAGLSTGPHNDAPAVTKSDEVAALQERLKALEEKIKTKPEPKVAVVAPPIQNLSAPSFRSIAGKWCGETSNYIFSKETLSVVFHDGQPTRNFKITDYQYAPGKVTVHWIGKGGKVFTDFSEFGSDGRTMAQQKNNAGPRRPFHRC